MKYLFIGCYVLASISLAQYEKGKIDMHGGKKAYMKSGSNFSKNSMNLSGFLDDNNTKKANSIKK